MTISSYEELEKEYMRIYVLLEKAIKELDFLGNEEIFDKNNIDPHEHARIIRAELIKEINNENIGPC